MAEMYRRGPPRKRKLFSEEIVVHLHTLDDRPWPYWGKLQKPITKNQLARLLSQFKIRPGTKRQGDETFKGYYLESFTDAFSRYLSSEDPQEPPFQTVTPAQSSCGATSEDIQTATPKNTVTDRNPPKTAPDIRCDAVTVQNGGNSSAPFSPDPDPTSTSWIVTYPDGRRGQKNCMLRMTRAHVLRKFPDVIDAVPIDDIL